MKYLEFYQGFEIWLDQCTETYVALRSGCNLFEAESLPLIKYGCRVHEKVDVFGKTLTEDGLC